jgi:hypothetical protein
MWQCGMNFLPVKTMCRISEITVKKSNHEWDDAYSIRFRLYAPTYPEIDPVDYSAFYRVSNETAAGILKYFTVDNERGYLCKVRPRIRNIFRLKGSIYVDNSNIGPTVAAIIVSGIIIVAIGVYFYVLAIRKYCPRRPRRKYAPVFAYVPVDEEGNPQPDDTTTQMKPLHSNVTYANPLVLNSK